MKTYDTKVIRSGNSYALRVPKSYIEDAGLREGEIATIPLPAAKPKKQDRAEIARLIRQLQEAGKAGKAGKGLASIKDPVAWQREIRKDRPLPGRDY